MRTFFLLSLLSLVLICTGEAWAQSTGEPTSARPQATTTSQINPPPEVATGKAAGSVSLMSNREFWLSCVILVFGVFIILVEFYLLRAVVREKTEEISRTYTVTLIIIGTLVLISSGFTNEQIAPALGLFGTIAGYLLGRGDARRLQSDSTKGDSDVK
ncbi:hypothetical protein [Variovorax guangxiensis]|uniref:hypothetical protein n=1 Tax=Variovorax guangxiensis TaxID=1775474 RepID=UPI00285F2509|nr:hypothetical protein [Variovorax guangxiensis]MDR6859854.1 small-conductance mechanosensitive channel [Variovorax guangxiensis]